MTQAAALIDCQASPRNSIASDLAGVSETMLWSLHNRAIEATRPDGVLKDPGSVRIHAAIDYDFAGRFGDPSGSLATRAAEIDRVLRTWLATHPLGTIVSLGEGLETQAQRVDNGRMQWLTVDLPNAIRLQERFLPPTRRLRHIADSALDPVWMDAVDRAHGAFIVAQGLLMYLPADAVRAVVTGIAARFPGAELVFDAIPRWFSRLTVTGLNQTARYRLPDMPVGHQPRRDRPGPARLASAHRVRRLPAPRKPERPAEPLYRLATGSRSRATGCQAWYMSRSPAIAA